VTHLPRFFPNLDGWTSWRYVFQSIEWMRTGTDPAALAGFDQLKALIGKSLAD